MNQMNKKQKTTIIFFIFLALICFLTPISGDDFGNYISTNGKLSEAISIAISYYKSWEGRFLGRIIIMYFTRHKILWNIITSVLFTIMTFNIFKILKNKTSYILLILGLLLVNNDMFAQGYTWLAGSITYLYPSCLMIIYLITIYKNYNKYKQIDKIIIIILNIIIPLFVENIACGLIIGNIAIIIYNYLLEHKINKLYILNLILSSTSLIIMLLSPGSHDRNLTENTLFNSLNIFEKVIYNIPNLNFYLFFKNTTMILLMLIPIIYYLLKKKKYLTTGIISSVSILLLINNIYYMLPMKFEFLEPLKFINTSNPLYIIYWLVYSILFILSINKIIIDKRKKSFIYLLLITGITSSLVMLILPTWGDRITLYSYITIIISSIILIDNIIKNDHKISKYLNITLYFTYILFITCFISIYKVNNYREKYIKEQLDNNVETIEIIRNPFMYIWNNNPQSEYFIKTYKSYMDIETNIEIKQLSMKEYLNILLRSKP